MKPRVVIVSEDLVEPWDEGIKKFASSVGRALSSDHPVRVINVDRGGLAAARNGAGAGSAGAEPIHTVPGSRTFLSGALRREIASFHPDVVVYVPSPSSTAGSFLRAFALRSHAPRARQAMVALIPRRHPARLKPFLSGTAPDVVLVPSYVSLLHLCDLGLRGDVVPVGVDPAQFRRVQPGEREALRRARGVPADAYVYLHVGHLSPNRNVGVLARLAREPGAHVIVIGSTSTPADAGVRDELEAAGVRVIREFVPVEEFYRLADCYVFPVVHAEGCVEIPLSVLEALSSGLPVIARPFGGLRDFLAEGADLRYFDDDEQMLARARELRAGPKPEARDMAEFAWRAVAERIVARAMATGEARTS